MPRKIPNRSGTAVSNADRLDRSQRFTASASKYAGAVPETTSVRPLSAPRPADETVEQLEDRKPRKEEMGATAGPPTKSAKRALASEQVSQDIAAALAPLTYYVRIQPDETRKLEDLGARTGLSVGYLKQALIKAVRQKMAALRDAGAWSDLAATAEARLRDAKGAGAPFLKTTIRLEREDRDALHGSIADPLGVYATTQVLSAYGKTVLGLELDRLCRALIGTETPASDPGQA